MIGRCHTCPRIEEVKFCSQCQHWFCQQCRKLSVTRVKAFFDEVLNGPRLGCCGPDAEVEAGFGARDVGRLLPASSTHSQPRLEQDNYGS